MKCSKKWFGALLFLCWLVFGSTPVWAYVSEGPCVDISNGNLKVSGFINSSEIDYNFEQENRDDAEMEAERKIIGLSLTKAYSKNLDFYGTVGYLFDGSLKPEHADDYELDDGYFLSGGARYMIHQSGNATFHIFGQLDYILEEKYSKTENGIDRKVEGYELSLGGAVRFQIDKNFATYASLSFVPFSDLSYDYEGANGSADGDVERDDNLGFRLGASYLINREWSLRGEADFASDSAYVVSAGMRF